MIDKIKQYLLTLQKNITDELTLLDGGAKFLTDKWGRPDKKGFGKTKVMSNGAIFEQAGVNFSQISGDKLPKSATAKRPELAGRNFTALGVSLVIHPKNPFIPTSHANVRFFVAEKENEKAVWWFGGGYDLTPYYAFDEDCIHWHNVAKNACNDFGSDVYLKYKKWCDEYFYLKHRNEQRGIGGLFFDDLNKWGFDKCFSFMQSIGNSYMKAYAPIVNKRKNTKFSKKHKEFQLYRRGRYVEFNLIYDRGTIFGLQTGGRTESILMSMPPLVNWQYMYKPTAGSLEEKLVNYYLKPKNWI